jgi:hypothetical protein
MGPKTGRPAQAHIHRHRSAFGWGYGPDGAPISGLCPGLSVGNPHWDHGGGRVAHQLPEGPCRRNRKKPCRVIYRVMDKNVYVLLMVDGRRDMQSLLQRRLLGA